jgi:hypothetical protein
MTPKEEIEDLASRKDCVLRHKDRMVGYSIYVRRGKFDNAKLNEAILKELHTPITKALARLIETDYDAIARIDRRLKEVAAKRDEKPLLSYEADIEFNFD